MRILQQRLLRGANLYSPSSCIMAVLESSLPEAGQQAAYTTRFLQQACDEPVSFMHAEPVVGQPTQWRVVVEYAMEHVGQAALAAAVELISATERDEAPDIATAVEQLRALASSMQLSSTAQAVAREAAAMGVPVQRISEHGGLIRLGWGHRQWRYADGAGDDNRLLTNTLLHDRQMMRSLLIEAQLPVPNEDFRNPQRQPGERLRVQVLAGTAQHADAQAAQVAERAAATLGLAHAQVDLLPGRRVPRVDAVLGAVPPSHDQRMLLRELRMDKQRARIPVIGITGTNGKTTTTLMIAHAVQLAGFRTGCASTQGIALDGVVYAEGDCTGYWSHRSVLASPETEFAVLETARGGLLKRGLAYDRCSVGVMLNVSDDHLGLDGVDTVEQLARVKSLVVNAAEVAVLNADDAHCVAARARLPADTRVVYFSMKPDNPVLQRHLEQGGDAVWLENDVLMLSQRQLRQRVMPATHIPATWGGLARYNIANSMAAAAALMASGFSVAQISAGLSSFESDAVTNPLRSNVFELGTIRVLLDYAHNPAAYSSLATLARGLAQGQGQSKATGQAPGRVLAVITSPGDRRDEDLSRTGATCAAHFDELFVYESQSRDRKHGEAAEIIAAGARKAGGAAVHVYATDAEAVQAGYRACQPGDVLVFACGTGVATLIEAIRAIDAPAAERLAQQAAPAA
ncbi:Mur ligase family protein [Duganella sp. sic0402]|uniref:Mur ligase family protein n=1 Tax=Duganella sp. sic0402 TaxID=2854786 RepID=UPI001E2C2335|nr:Mur ligase family protein [Duganella sp. sic0402]